MFAYLAWFAVSIFRSVGRGSVLECGGPPPLSHRRTGDAKAAEGCRSPRPRGLLAAALRSAKLRFGSNRFPPRLSTRRCGDRRSKFFRDAKSRCRSGLHSPGCGGSTPPSCSRSLRTATILRVANFDSEVPALNRRELGANPRRPTIL